MPFFWVLCNPHFLLGTLQPICFFFENYATVYLSSGSPSPCYLRIFIWALRATRILYLGQFSYSRFTAYSVVLYFRRPYFTNLFSPHTQLLHWTLRISIYLVCYRDIFYTRSIRFTTPSIFRMLLDLSSLTLKLPAFVMHSRYWQPRPAQWLRIHLLLWQKYAYRHRVRSSCL
jgi:hypothetical protein